MTPATTSRPTCSIGDCEKPAERVTAEGIALCAGHRKRLQRLRRGASAPPVDAPLRGELTPLERVIVAADDFIDVSSEDDAAYGRALIRFRAACSAWMRSLGWNPPAVLVDDEAGDAVTQPAAPSSPVRPAPRDPGGPHDLVQHVEPARITADG